MEKDILFLDGKTKYLNISKFARIIYNFSVVQMKILQEFLKECDKEISRFIWKKIEQNYLTKFWEIRLQKLQ